MYLCERSKVSISSYLEDYSILLQNTANSLYKLIIHALTTREMATYDLNIISKISLNKDLIKFKEITNQKTDNKYKTLGKYLTG